MIGQERTVPPLLAQRGFGLSALTAALTFIVAFGLTKPVANFLAGALSDRSGRKPVLVAGWLFGLPVPLVRRCGVRPLRLLAAGPGVASSPAPGGRRRTAPRLSSAPTACGRRHAAVIAPAARGRLDRQHDAAILVL
jgi:MFS family permease